MNREPIYAALGAKLTGLPGVKTFSRRLRHWSDVPPGEQPAIFLAMGGEVPEQSSAGIPTLWRLTPKVYIYAQSSDPVVAPSTILNDLLDAVEAALAPAGGTGKQMLGGLAEHAWISGPIETDEGVLGDQSMAIVPLEILVP